MAEVVRAKAVEATGWAKVATAAAMAAASEAVALEVAARAAVATVVVVAEMAVAEVPLVRREATRESAKSAFRLLLALWGGFGAKVAPRFQKDVIVQTSR